MATIEQCDNLQSVCADVLTLEMNKEKYISRPEWGEMSFRSVEPHLEKVFSFAKELQFLQPYNILIVPEKNVTRTTELFLSLIQKLQEIDSFNILQENAPSVHNSYTNSLRSTAEGIALYIGTWIPLLSMQDEERENLSAKIKATSDKATTTLKEAGEYVQSKKEEIESVLQVARAQSGTAGAAVFTEQFEKEASAARKRSVRWLIPTGFLVVAALTLSILFMLGLFIGIPTNTSKEASTNTSQKTSISTLEIVYGIGGRVIGISILFYAAIWSGRIALANMHLSSVNKHRAISLETLQAFQNAVDDVAARDAVVLEAARAVYENVPSGYIGRQTSEHGGGGRILELIRSARPQPSQPEGAGPPQV